jgi:hypothetical protein
MTEDHEANPKMADDDAREVVEGAIGPTTAADVFEALTDRGFVVIPRKLLYHVEAMLRTLNRSGIRLDEDFPEAEFQEAKSALEDFMFPEVS